MRVLIYGAGVIGSIFAGKLMHAGHDVTVLARGKRYDELKRNGLILKKANSSVPETTHPKIIDSLGTDDIYDYIMVVMQKPQVSGVLPALKENRSENIVFVVNNPSGYDEWAGAIGKERIMLGFPAAGGERKDGVVNYFVMNGPLRLFQTTTFGEYGGRNTERLNSLVKAMGKAGISSVRSRDMDSWQKYHVALITAIANLLYRYGADNYEASRHYRDIHTCARAIQEGFSVLRSLGHRVTPGKLKIYLLPAFMVALVLKLVLKTGFSEITMAKHTRAAIDEIRCLQQEFDILIKKSRLITPNIDRLRIRNG
jgi:2-dehydropantoate 2-reductase